MPQKRKCLQDPLPDLFDQVTPKNALPPAQHAELLALVRSLMQEIAANLVSGEAGHDKDHG